MLLTTHAGILVNSDHIACIALRRELPTPSEPDPLPGTPPTFRVLLSLSNGICIVAARGLLEDPARFVREDIAHAWATGKPRWKAEESLRRHAAGAYFAMEDPVDDSVEDNTEHTPETLLSRESEETNGEQLSPLSDLQGR